LKLKDRIDELERKVPPYALPSIPYTTTLQWITSCGRRVGLIYPVKHGFAVSIIVKSLHLSLSGKL
jgi:hypothetical protein